MSEKRKRPTRSSKDDRTTERSRKAAKYDTDEELSLHGEVDLLGSSESSETSDQNDSSGDRFICDSPCADDGECRSVYYSTGWSPSEDANVSGGGSFSQRYRELGVYISQSEEEDGEDSGGVRQRHAYEDELSYLRDNQGSFDDIGTITTTDAGYPHTVVYDNIGNSYLTAEGYINSDNFDMFEDQKINCVCGPMGIGKSTYDKSRVQEAIGRDIPVIYVTYTRTLCRTTASQYGLTSYQETDIGSRITEKSLTRLVICVNSLRKLEKNDWWKTFSVIILDEIAGILATLYDSSLMVPSEAKAVRGLLIKMMTEKRQNGFYPTVKVNDALLGEAEIYWLTQVVDPSKQRIKLFEFRPKQISEQLPRIVIVKDFTNWVVKLVDRLTGVAKERVVLVTGQKKLTGNLVTLLTEVDPNIKSYLNIDDDKWDKLNAVASSNLWLDGDSSAEYLKEVTDDPLSLMKYNLFGYSPVVSSGVSWTTPVEWDVGFGITGTHISAEIFTQMLRRARVIRQKVFYVHFTSKPVTFSFSLEVENLSRMIAEYATVTEPVRKELAVAMGMYNRNPRKNGFLHSTI